VNGGWLRAAGAGRQCAPAALIRRFCAAPHELPDGSIAIFGSRFDRGATAAVTRVYPDGSYKVFVIEPQHQSAFYYDAVATTNKKEFAATRWIGVQPVLEWIVFK
jgi:hypothetical protein